MSGEFHVSAEAHQKLASMLEDHPNAKAVRVFLQEDKCNGPSLLISLDERKDSDLASESDGIIYVIDKALFTRLEGVSVDFVVDGGRAGFSIQSEADLGLRSDACKDGCGC